MDDARIGSVLAGVSYPARTWQLLAEAQHYGADIHTRTELGRLPVGTYLSLEAVLRALREQAGVGSPDPRALLR
jgi:hypothetical protein